MTLSAKSGHVRVEIKPGNTSGKQLDKVSVEIPFPKETHSFGLTADYGKVTPDEISKVVRWEIGKYPKDKVPTLEGTVSLPSDFEGVAKPTCKLRII